MALTFKTGDRVTTVYKSVKNTRGLIKKIENEQATIEDDATGLISTHPIEICRLAGKLK